MGFWSSWWAKDAPPTSAGIGALPDSLQYASGGALGGGAQYIPNNPPAALPDPQECSMGGKHLWRGKGERRCGWCRQSEREVTLAAIQRGDLFIPPLDHTAWAVADGMLTFPVALLKGLPHGSGSLGSPSQVSWTWGEVGSSGTASGDYIITLDPSPPSVSWTSSETWALASAAFPETVAAPSPPSPQE